MATGAFDEALRRFEAALSIPDQVGDRRAIADLLFKKGQALRSLAQGEQAIGDWHAALDIYQELGEAEGIARTVYDAAWETSWQPPGSAVLDG